MTDPGQGAERVYKGIPVSAGIAQGKIFVLSRAKSSIPKYDVPEPELAQQIQRLHQALVDQGLRTRVGLVTDTATAWHEHHVACQLGFGADAVHPWMALEWAQRLSEPAEPDVTIPDSAPESSAKRRPAARCNSNMSTKWWEASSMARRTSGNSREALR